MLYGSSYLDPMGEITWLKCAKQECSGPILMLHLGHLIWMKGHLNLGPLKPIAAGGVGIFPIGGAVETRLTAGKLTYLMLLKGGEHLPKIQNDFLLDKLS